jgi:hypothetical protein
MHCIVFGWLRLASVEEDDVVAVTEASDLLRGAFLFALPLALPLHATFAPPPPPTSSCQYNKRRSERGIRGNKWQNGSVRCQRHA